MARQRKKPAGRGKVPIPRHASFYMQYTCCGMPSCKKCGGVNYAHGPYWYASWRERLDADGRPVKARNAPGRPNADDVEHEPSGSPGRQRTAYVGARLLPWQEERAKSQNHRGA